MSGVVRRTGALAKAVATDALRRRVGWVVLLFAVVMAAAIPSLPSYGEAIEASIYREVALALAFVAAAVVALALSANRMPSEVERRSVYPVLARGVSRAEYIIGTWVGIAAVLAAVLAAFTVLSQILGLVYFHEPMWTLWEGAAGVWMEVSVLAALTMAVTARTGPVTSVVAALTFLFVAHSRASLLVPGTMAWRLYPSLDVFNVIDPVAHGTGVSPAYLAVMSGAFLAWVAVLLAGGIAAFAGRDL